MTFTRKTIFTLAAASLAVGTMAFAGGHNLSEAEQALKARKAHMQLYAHNLGILGAFAKGEAEFDAAAAQAAADNLVSLASINQMSYWHPDSSSMDLDTSRSLPELWDNIPDAIAKGEGMLQAASAMQAAAGTLEGVQGAIGQVGGACGACHKPYRQPNN
jgi:cytochrome c556